MRRQYVSNFTGSAGTAIVTHDQVTLVFSTLKTYFFLCVNYAAVYTELYRTVSSQCTVKAHDTDLVLIGFRILVRYSRQEAVLTPPSKPLMNAVPYLVYRNVRTSNQLKDSWLVAVLKSDSH
jgi:hypothetical protein